MVCLVYHVVVCFVVYIPRNVVWYTFFAPQVHFAQVLEYTPFAKTPDFNFHEIIVGPMNAAPFRETDLDDSFSPNSLFYYGPECEPVGQYVGISVSTSVNRSRPFAETDLDDSFSPNRLYCYGPVCEPVGQ